MRKLFSSIEINNCRFIGTLDIGMFYLVLFIALINSTACHVNISYIVTSPRL